MNDISLSDWVERSILLLGAGIGNALPGELTPNPGNYTAAQKAQIIRDHTKNTALFDDWFRYLENLAVKNPREIVLLNILGRRIQECCSILMSLLGQVN